MERRPAVSARPAAWLCFSPRCLLILYNVQIAGVGLAGSAIVSVVENLLAQSVQKDQFGTIHIFALLRRFVTEMDPTACRSLWLSKRRGDKGSRSLQALLQIWLLPFKATQKRRIQHVAELCEASCRGTTFSKLAEQQKSASVAAASCVAAFTSVPVTATSL